MLTIGFKIILAQAERDKSMDKLVRMMNDVYKYVNAHNPFKTLDKDRMEVLERLIVQTIDCAYFIQEHSKVNKFCKLAFLRT
jgi:calcineurin-like phosphoesterase family protein